MENTLRESTSPSSAPTNNRSDVVDETVVDKTVVDKTVQVGSSPGRNPTLIPDGNTHTDANEGVLDLPSNTTTFIDEDINPYFSVEEANEKFAVLLNKLREFASHLSNSPSRLERERGKLIELIANDLEKSRAIFNTAVETMETSGQLFLAFLDADMEHHDAWWDERDAARDIYSEVVRIASTVHSAEERIARVTEWAEKSDRAHEQYRLNVQSRHCNLKKMWALMKKAPKQWFDVLDLLPDLLFRVVQLCQYNYLEGRIENVEEGEEDVAGVIDRDNFANDGAIGGNVNDAEADDGKQHNVEVKEDEQE